MNETKNIEKARSEPESKELYLPAMSAEPRFNRVEQVLHHARQREPGRVERRRYERYTVEESVPVTLMHSEAQRPVELRDYSCGGARLNDAPALQEGERVTLVFHPEYGPEVKKQGVIRSCQSRDGSSRAMLGVKVDIPLEMLPGDEPSRGHREVGR